MSRTLDILDRLIGFDTVSAKSNLDLIDYVQGLLTGCGARVTRIDDPALPKAGLYAEIGPAAAGGVLLSGHCDVVPTAGQDWTRPAFRLTREGDRLYGRGTTDMKGFVASMLAAAERAAGMDLAAPLKLVLSYDEEVGCTGIAQMLGSLAPLLGQPRAAIVGEPTQMQVAIGHKGKQGFRAVARGQAGHSALAPRFVNALYVAADFMGQLRGMQADLAGAGARDAAYDIPYSTVHTGVLQGGRALNIVPDLAELTFEFRHLAEDDPKALRDRIDRAAEAAVAAHGPAARIEITPLASYPGLDAAPGAPVVALAQGWARTGLTKVPFGTEAGVFAGLGVPTVVCGPGSMEGQGHKADEYITAQALAECDAMMDRVLLALS